MGYPRYKINNSFYVYFPSVVVDDRGDVLALMSCNVPTLGDGYPIAKCSSAGVFSLCGYPTAALDRSAITSWYYATRSLLRRLFGKTVGTFLDARTSPADGSWFIRVRDVIHRYRDGLVIAENPTLVGRMWSCSYYDGVSVQLEGISTSADAVCRIHGIEIFRVCCATLDVALLPFDHGMAVWTDPTMEDTKRQAFFVIRDMLRMHSCDLFTQRFDKWNMLLNDRNVVMRIGARLSEFVCRDWLDAVLRASYRPARRGETLHFIMPRSAVYRGTK